MAVAKVVGHILRSNRQGCFWVAKHGCEIAAAHLAIALSLLSRTENWRFGPSFDSTGFIFAV
jgi:hypothetical protein